MPGRYEDYEEVRTKIEQEQISEVICLNSLNEIRQKSPEYARAIEACQLPFSLDMFPIPDFGIPEDRGAFLKLAQSVSSRLKTGANILIHCGAGIGRTGVLAICVLMVLGIPPEQAVEKIKETGSGPETEPQEELIQQIADFDLGLTHALRA